MHCFGPDYSEAPSNRLLDGALTLKEMVLQQLELFEPFSGPNPEMAATTSSWPRTRSPIRDEKCQRPTGRLTGGLRQPNRVGRAGLSEQVFELGGYRIDLVGAKPSLSDGRPQRPDPMDLGFVHFWNWVHFLPLA